MRKTVSSAGKLFGANTVCAEDGSPYLTRIWFWRLRLHIFHRGDSDQDGHDHPWNFVTFPLTSYVEEVIEPVFGEVRKELPQRPVGFDTSTGKPLSSPLKTILISDGIVDYVKKRQVVTAFRFHRRPAEHTHRVLGRYAGNAWAKDHKMMLTGVSTNWVNSCDHLEPYYEVPTRKIVTLVWFSKPRRSWGFLKNRDGEWCWVPWKEYVFGGGKDGPCQ